MTILSRNLRTDRVAESFPRKHLWREGTDAKQEVSRETRLASRVNKPEVHFDGGAAERFFYRTNFTKRNNEAKPLDLQTNGREGKTQALITVIDDVSRVGSRTRCGENDSGCRVGLGRWRFTGNFKL